MAYIGILGGMGPSATVDFMDKIIQLTPATKDQEHLPAIVANLPQIPDRSKAILGEGADPLPALLSGIDLLNTAKVGVVAIPCNSSHHWYTKMAERSHCPVIHIAQACVMALKPAAGVKVAILATRGALASGFYQAALSEKGIEYFVPNDASGQSHIDECIRSVKGGNVPAGTAALNIALQSIADAGATAVIMGCTEIPIAARNALPTSLQLIDSSLELARATVTFALQRGWNQAA